MAFLRSGRDSHGGGTAMGATAEATAGKGMLIDVGSTFSVV